MPLFRMCHRATIRFPRRSPRDNVPHSSCKIQLILRGYTSKTVTMSVLQGRRWGDLESSLHDGIINNIVWKNILFRNPDQVTHMRLRDIKINFFRRGSRLDSSIPDYPLHPKDADTILWFTDDLEAPQLMVEVPNEMRKEIFHNKSICRTYRHTEPKLNLFVAYSAFGKLYDCLRSFQDGQSWLDRTSKATYPKIEERDEALILVLEFCRNAAQESVDQIQRLNFLARLLRKLLESMETHGDIKPKTLEVRKCKSRGSRNENFILELWANGTWPVGMCVVTGDPDVECISTEDQMLKVAYEWSSDYYARRQEFQGVKRLPFFGLQFCGPYLQFVGLQYVPKRELALMRFTDMLSLIHQTDDMLARESQLLMGLQCLLMSCVELGEKHEHEPPLKTEEELKEALDASRRPCYTSFKYEGNTYPLKYGNSANENNDHISYHIGSSAQIYAASCSKLPGKELIVKFCMRYGLESHQFLARRGWAPRIYTVEEIPGRLLMVVMKRSPGIPLSLLVYNYMESHPAASYLDVQAVFSPYLRQLNEVILLLHKRGLVHGDVRAPNVIIELSRLSADKASPTSNTSGEASCTVGSQSTRHSTENSDLVDNGYGARVHLIDFDWAGPIGEARYPTLLNRRTNFPDDARRGGLIEPKHDLEMLDNICKMPFDLWRNHKAEATRKKGVPREEHCRQ